MKRAAKAERDIATSLARAATTSAVLWIGMVVVCSVVRAGHADAVFSIGKASQAIVFAPLSPKTFGDAPFGVWKQSWHTVADRGSR